MSKELKRQNGCEVIEEAVQLLNQMRFWSNCGAYAEGDHVAVSVDPQWNDDKESIEVLITCYAFGHWQVDWKGIPVFILPETGNINAIRRLNARGQAIIPSLPLGDYRLSTSLHYGYSEEDVPVPIREQMPRQQEVAAKIKLPVQMSPAVYYSVDRRVKAEVFQDPTDKTFVIFKTNEAKFRFATVRFAFVGTSEQIEQSAEVILNEEEQESWKGSWQQFIVLREPCKLVFEVVPKDE
jgi:hypothetical protein